jgi:hypothetical protein
MKRFERFRVGATPVGGTIFGKLSGQAYRHSLENLARNGDKPKMSGVIRKYPVRAPSKTAKLEN